ncbi:MAG TPA: hypothetical protein VM425_09725 [Myxococcota bacterium]|nr:hypothetical protein [Myxococcota bacterium]
MKRFLPAIIILFFVGNSYGRDIPFIGGGQCDYWPVCMKTVHCSNKYIDDSKGGFYPSDKIITCTEYNMRGRIPSEADVNKAVGKLNKYLDTSEGKKMLKSLTAKHKKTCRAEVEYREKVKSELLTSYKGKPTYAETAATNKEIIQLWNEFCANPTSSRARKAILKDSEYKAKQFKISTDIGENEEYKKIDENTWRQIKTDVGLCNLTVVSTLFRKEKDSVLWWQTVQKIYPETSPVGKDGSKICITGKTDTLKTLTYTPVYNINGVLLTWSP